MSDEKQITDYIFATKHQVQCKKTTFSLTAKIMYKNVEKTVLGGSPKKTPTSPRNLMRSLDLSGHGLKVEPSKSASRDEGEIGMPNSSGVRMTGIVWKRRSGLGKYSAKAAWERRRVILRGTKIMYYRTGQDVDDQEESDDESGEEKASGGGWSKPRRSVLPSLEQRLRVLEVI